MSNLSGELLTGKNREFLATTIDGSDPNVKLVSCHGWFTGGDERSTRCSRWVHLWRRRNQGMARQRARHITDDQSETLSLRADPKQGAPFGNS